jgi:DNA-binding XRE family transcriptional regulator
LATDKTGREKGRPQSTVGRMEGTNPMEPRVGLAIQVARALDTTVESLFDDGEERSLEDQLEILTRHLHEITRQIQEKKAA